VDERHVPHSHPDSNHRAMCEHVYGAPGWVRGGSKQVQPVNTSLPLADSAAEYEERLLREFSARPGSVPRFDVVLLGLGEDGHTASLFPGSPALQLDITRDPARAEAEARRIAAITGRPAAVRVRLVCGVEDAPKPPASRVTLTLSAINAANNVGLFAGGAGKAPAAAAVLEQVSTRFSARNRGAPLPVSVVDSHLPAALIGLMDNAWPAAYFLDAEAASRISPAAGSTAAAARATSPTGAGATGSGRAAGAGAAAAAAYPHVPAATPAAAAASPSSSGVPDKKAVF
jgi:6-phosphogluconolactonase/glucosamine-6-phosphate isomerase/deaminase